MTGPGRCVCGRVHGSAAEREACRKRVACHAAGHAVAFCLVFARECREGGLRPSTVGLDGEAESVCAAAVARDPWKEALVWFGGNAAEDLLFGERLGHESEARNDWRRAERCLREIDRYALSRDAFLVTRELLDHNRPALDAVTDALLAQTRLSGEDVWNLTEANPPSGPASRSP